MADDDMSLDKFLVCHLAERVAREAQLV